MTLELLLDCAQYRPSRLAATAALSSRDFEPLSGTWKDPVTGTIHLLPPQVEEAWYTTNSGRFTKPSSYTHSSAGNWEMVSLYPGAGNYAYTSTIGEYALTAIGENAAAYLGFYVPNAGDASVIIEFGFTASTPDYLNDIGFRLWSDGRCEVWESGVFQKTYNVATGENGSNSRASTPTMLLILPSRGRDIIVASSAGGGFVHTIQSIPEGETGTITPAGDFYALNVSSTNFFCQLGEIEFPTSGTCISLPVVGDFDGDIFQRWFHYGTEPTLSFDPDGDFYRATATLTDGQFCGVVVTRPADYVETDSSEEFDLAPYCMGVTISQSDDAAGGSVDIRLKNPDEIASLVPNFLELENRPFRLVMDGVTQFEGVTMPIRYQDAVWDGAREAFLNVRSRIHEMKDLVFLSSFPWDGYVLDEAVAYCFQQIGIANADIIISDTDFEIPWVPPSDPGDAAFRNLAEIGSSMHEAADGLVQQFAPTFLWGSRPGPFGMEYVFIDPVDLDPDPVATLYRSRTDAIAAGDDDALLYDDYYEEPLPIEANEVRATGESPRTGEIFQSFAKDEDSQDPSLAPSLRPSNWRGQPKLFGIADPQLGTQDAADRAVVYTFPQVSGRYFVGEWRSEAIIKADGCLASRGDLIALDGRRDLRISSYNIEILKVQGTWWASEARYTGGTLTNAGGIGLEAIKRFSELRAQRPGVKRSVIDFGLQVASSATQAP